MGITTIIITINTIIIIIIAVIAKEKRSQFPKEGTNAFTSVESEVVEEQKQIQSVVDTCKGPRVTGVNEKRDAAAGERGCF